MKKPRNKRTITIKDIIPTRMVIFEKFNTQVSLENLFTENVVDCYVYYQKYNNYNRLYFIKNNFIMFEYDYNVNGLFINKELVTEELSTFTDYFYPKTKYIENILSEFWVGDVNEEYVDLFTIGLETYREYDYAIIKDSSTN